MFVFIISLSFFSFAVMAENTYININVNGKAVNFNEDKPIMDENSRIIVPIRAICEEIGADVSWDEIERSTVISFNGNKITFKTNDKIIDVNGEKKEIETEAKIINTKTYVPLRSISENIGISVEWDGSLKTANLIFNIPEDENFKYCYIYEDDIYNYSIKIPKSWEGLYSISKEENDIKVCSKSNEEAGKGGVLFRIKVLPKEQFDNMKEDILNPVQKSELERDEENVYVLLYASDIQYDLENEKLMQEYIDMSKDIGLITESFELNK